LKRVSSCKNRPRGYFTCFCSAWLNRWPGDRPNRIVPVQSLCLQGADILMKISEILTPHLVKIGLESEEKDELFEEMVQLFMDAGRIDDRDAALQALREREAKMSTGVAKWLALPHGKIEEISELLMALGVSRTGIEYDSLDGEPVYVVLMVFAEVGNPGPHIEALAEISRLFSVPGFTEKVRAAGTAGEVLNLIRDQE